jgi:hypothetical protein
MAYSDIVRAPGLVWDGTQERPLDSGGSAEWGRFEDDLLEDDCQLIHTFRTQFLVAHPPARVCLSLTSSYAGLEDGRAWIILLGHWLRGRRLCT